MERSAKRKCIYQSSDGKWAVDTRYQKRRIRKRGFTTYTEAEQFLDASTSAHALSSEQVSLTLKDAAARYLLEKEKKGMPSAVTDAYLLIPIVKCLGSLTLEEITDDTASSFVSARQKAGIKNKSINNALSVVNSICKLAATRWRRPDKTSFLKSHVPLEMLVVDDQRPPRPISWKEQDTLLECLPEHAAETSLFILNTSVRQNVVCQLRWAWEIKVDIGGTKVSIFVVPRAYVKGRKMDRIIVCNSLAQEIIDRQRGRHEEFVFTHYRSLKEGSDKQPVYKPIGRLLNTAWENGRVRAGLDDLHVHDLRHTVGMRLRQAGISERTQDEILWHSNRSMSTHYAVAQIKEIYDALNLIAAPGRVGETINLLAVLRRAQIRRVA